jgi:hypothetical protein
VAWWFKKDLHPLSERPRNLSSWSISTVSGFRAAPIPCPHPLCSSPLAALLTSTFQGSPTSVTAGTIVVRANNTAIQTLDDIRDQRVATCESPLIPATVLTSHLLRARDLDLLLVARQVQRFKRLEEPLTALIRGDADVAILEAGVLESMVRNGVLDMADIRVVEEILPSALPYRHTTRTYPNEGVMASKFSPRAIAIRSAVQSALQRLDSTSTAATAMFGRGWAGSVSNMAVVTVLEAMDMLELVDANAICHGRTVWQCPRNALQAGNSAELPCSRVPCPSGARCTCQPCILGDDVSVSGGRPPGTGEVRMGGQREESEAHFVVCLPLSVRASFPPAAYLIHICRGLFYFLTSITVDLLCQRL